ncbi:MAG TPA: retropepsin-like aspartic protease [Gemmatimonadaceae bacterium]|nr:retropepsin-like aspartic protease [Gemmatimonadaceae bacterium]
MRQIYIGARAGEHLVSLSHLHTRAWAIATLLALLASTEASASGNIDRDSIFPPRERPSPPFATLQPAGADPDSSSAAATNSPTNLYSEAYWSAVSDLDLSEVTRTARSTQETEFARGMNLLANGDFAAAETMFATLGRGAGDFNVGIAAQMMLAHTLMYERKWSALRDLPANPELKSEDKRNTAELERWGHAFANIEPQSIAFPAKPASMKLEITALGTPAIKVKINGKEYEFWLDTGSGITVLSSEVAADAGVPTISSDSLTVRTFSGTASVRPALVRKMTVGQIVLTNTPAIIIDASMMLLKSPTDGLARVNQHVDGILGWDFIRQFDLLMDYDEGTLQLARPETDVQRSGVQNLTWIGQPLVEVRTSDGKTLHLALDTGAQATLLNATVLDKVGGVTKSIATHLYGLARTTTSNSRIIPELPLQVAGKSVQLHNVIVYGPRYSGLIGCDGILGSDVGQFGVLHIDATNGVFSVGV